MAEINTVIAEASQDLQTIEDFVNLPADSEVYPRLLPSVNVGTLAGTRDAIFRAGGLPATPFATKALMTASALVDGDYAMVTDDTVNNGLYVKTAGAWVNSAYDPVSVAHTTSEGQLYFDTIYFNNIRFEKSGTTVYVQVSSYPSQSPISEERGTEGILYRRGYKSFTISADVLLDAIETSGKVLEPSPSGKLQNCFKINSFELLLFSAKLSQFKIVVRDNLPLTTSGGDDWTILIGNNFGDIGIGPFGGLNLAKLVSDDLQQVRAEALSDAAMGVIDIWCYKPYYEFTTGNTAPFYFKPTGYSGSYAIFCYDARFGKVLITVNQVYAAIRAYCTRTNKPESDFIMTSPKGVVECIKFYDNYTLFYSIKNKNLYFAPRFDKDPENLHVDNPSVKIIASDGTMWGVCEERVNLLKSYTEQKLAELSDTPVASSNLGGIRGVAHRGYSGEAPENTLPAYILAKKNGFKYVEADVLFTSDGVPVLLHDDTVDRTSNGTGAINSLTLAQVKALDFGEWKDTSYSGTQIPTLEEFLNLCRILQLHPYLEMKAMTTTQALAVAAAVDKCQMDGQVSFISFTYSALQAIAAAKPDARLGFVTTGKGTSAVNSTAALRTGRNQVFLDTKASGVNQALFDTIELAAMQDIPVEVWTVNSGTDAVAYVEAGVTGITTDTVIIEDEIALKYGLNT